MEGSFGTGYLKEKQRVGYHVVVYVTEPREYVFFKIEKVFPARSDAISYRIAFLFIIEETYQNKVVPRSRFALYF